MKISPYQKYSFFLAFACAVSSANAQISKHIFTTASWGASPESSSLRIFAPVGINAALLTLACHAAYYHYTNYSVGHEDFMAYLKKQPATIAATYAIFLMFCATGAHVCKDTTPPPLRCYLQPLAPEHGSKADTLGGSFDLIDHSSSDNLSDA